MYNKNLKINKLNIPEKINFENSLKNEENNFKKVNEDNYESFCHLKNIYLSGVQNKKMLNFEDIQEITKNSKILKNSYPKELETQVILTSEEKAIINYWIEDIEKYIVNYSLEGKSKLIYDCSKMKTNLFVELAKTFKMNNPKFYVEYDLGPQLIIISWGKK